MKIIEKEFNVITGETTFTERDETPQEEASRLEHAAQVVALQAESAQNATAKAALLAQLGITEEQARLLLL
jgi:hypothetical protein